MSTNTNHRTDEYGGSVENRVRLVVEVLEAVVAVFGADRVGIRISPNFVVFDLKDTEAEASSLYLAKQLTRLGVAYMHIAEPDWAGGEPLSDLFRQNLRAAFSGKIIVCGQYTAESGEKRLERGQADLIAFGRAYLANPDLDVRFRENAPLNKPNEATFYGGADEGYTDYPTLDGSTS
jgi:N-ethylmaleimide reductase